MTDPVATKRYTMRVGVATLAGWQSAADKAGLKLSAWLREAAADKIAGEGHAAGAQTSEAAAPPQRPTSLSHKRVAKAAAKLTPEQREAMTGPVPCRHPRAARVVKTYGTWCRACGDKIR